MEKLPTIFKVNINSVAHEIEFINKLYNAITSIEHYSYCQFKVVGIVAHPKYLYSLLEQYYKTAKTYMQQEHTPNKPNQWTIVGIPVMQTQDIAEDEIKLIIE